MALDVNDLRAREAHLLRAQEMARTVGPAFTIGRRLSEQMAAAAGMNSLGLHGRQVEAMINQLTMVATASPAHVIFPAEETRVTIAPSVQSRVIQALVIRVMLAAIVQSLIVAMWQEGRDSTPAAALSAIFAVIVAWYQLDEAIWNRFSE